MSFFKTQIEQLHLLGLTGRGIKVGHLDSGIEVAHPIFANSTVTFERFGYSGFDSFTETPFDSSGHGTETAALINGGQFDGVQIGIAPEAALYSGMVLEEGATIARILSGLEWLIDRGVHIVNLSLGIQGDSPVFQPLIQEMVARNILVVGSIGNRGAGKFNAPGRYPEVLSVGGLDEQGHIPAFSGSYHQEGVTVCYKPDVVAPGVECLTADFKGTVSLKTGTSLAAAHISGLAALLWQAFPNATAQMLKEAICTSCLDAPDGQEHRVANGLVQPLIAWQQLNERLDDVCWSPPTKVEGKTNRTQRKIVDKRLQDLLAFKSDPDLCDAIFCFSETNAKAFVYSVIEQNVPRSSKSKIRLKFFNYAPLVLIRAPRLIIKTLCDQPATQFAWAADVDRFTVGLF